MPSIDMRLEALTKMAHPHKTDPRHSQGRQVPVHNEHSRYSTILTGL